MEPQYSVLIYSKYSNNCKTMLETIQNSGVDFPNIVKLQLLCIDNEKIRHRIQSNKQIDVKTVPCILSIYSNGNVEKYDGDHVFKWVNGVIDQMNPKPTKEQLEYERAQRAQYERQQQEIREAEMRRLEEMKKGEAVREERIANEEKMAIQSAKSYPPSKTRNMKPVTSVDDIPYDDDRHISKPKPPTIRSGAMEYDMDESLFQDEMPTHRKPESLKSQEDPHGTLAKMKAMMQGREDIEEELNVGKKRGGQ